MLKEGGKEGREGRIRRVCSMMILNDWLDGWLGLVIRLLSGFPSDLDIPMGVLME